MPHWIIFFLRCCQIIFVILRKSTGINSSVIISTCSCCSLYTQKTAINVIFKFVCKLIPSVSHAALWNLIYRITFCEFCSFISGPLSEYIITIWNTKNAFEKVCKKQIHIMVICVVDEICLFSRKETWGMF